MLSAHRFCLAVTTSLSILLLSQSTVEGASFTDLPDTTEFVLNGSDAYHLLGAVRAVTSGDYDQDGDEDVLTVRNGGISAGVSPFVLFWNQAVEGNPLKFSVYDDTDTGLGLPYITGFDSAKDPYFWADSVDGSAFAGAVTADFNGDGWPDIFVGGSRGNSVFDTVIIDRSWLFMNVGAHAGSGDRKFVEIGLAAGLADTAGFCQGAAVADYNGDGILDIFMAMTEEYQPLYGGGSPNKLYMGTAAIDSFQYNGSWVHYPVFADSTTAWGVPQDYTQPHFALYFLRLQTDRSIQVVKVVRLP